jgi:two-component system sensor histidine kinase BarA
MKSENNPIDWELATKLAGNKREIAEEILTMLLKTLRHDIDTINQSYQQQQYLLMCKQLHKLHGALCYCGLPRLKKLVAQLESDIKNNMMDDLPEMVDALNAEVENLLSSTSL